MELRPVSFTWKKQPQRGKKLGFIAQEVQSVVSEVVYIGDDPDQMLGVYCADLIPVLTTALREQQEIIERQQTQIEQQQAADTTMRARIDDLSQKLHVPVASIAANNMEILGSIQGSPKVAQLTNGGWLDGRGAEVKINGN